jgi:hypothetical protein
MLAQYTQSAFRALARVTSRGMITKTRRACGGARRSASSQQAGESGPVLEELAARCLCISSYFTVPDQGITTPELLSRASGFLVRRSPPAGQRDATGRQGRVHIVASGHVIHPFRYPNYYPRETHEWLHCLRERNVETRVEVRAPRTGALLLSHTLAAETFHHRTRDIAVLHAGSDDALLAALREWSRHHVAELAPSARPGARVGFVGHRLLEHGDEEQVQVPDEVAGEALGATPMQAFFRTERTLVMGMCGGPVYDADGRCVGATEGIVPDTGPKALAGCAAVIGSEILGAFLDEIEAGLAPDKR